MEKMHTPVTVVILAAGLGTRMKSRQAKVLHRAGGKTMLRDTWSIRRLSLRRRIAFSS